MFKQQINTAIALITLATFFTACKKDNRDLMAETPAQSPVAAPAAPAGSSLVQLNLVAFQKSQDYYLWNTQLPPALNLTGFSDPAAVMTGLRQYSAEPGFTGPVDRWSFAMKKTEWDLLSSGLSSVSSSASAAGDFGISVFFKAEGDLRVRLTEPNSPAGAAGIRRGWRITKINGNTNITTSNSSFIVDQVYKSTASVITFLKSDGTAVDISLTANSYAKKPVYMDTVYNTATGKAGYLVYNSFIGNMNQSVAEYARVFSKFAAAGITDLIVDLRYNGGGYVDLQSKLANYIINNTASGSIMMRQIYNSNHAADNTTTNFNKTGAVNLNKVYFIVSRSTASASELLINNLKPYMDVRLIGASNTHGKPVGYFPIDNGEWYVFPVSFKTVNKNNEGNYYAGFAPNALVADGLDKDWGDISEASLASALNNISSGNFRSGSEPVYNESYNVAKGNTELDESMLKILIGKRK